MSAYYSVTIGLSLLGCVFYFSGRTNRQIKARKRAEIFDKIASLRNCTHPDPVEAFDQIVQLVKNGKLTEKMLGGPLDALLADAACCQKEIVDSIQENIARTDAEIRRFRALKYADPTPDAETEKSLSENIIVYTNELGRLHKKREHADDEYSKIYARWKRSDSLGKSLVKDSKSSQSTVQVMAS